MKRKQQYITLSMMVSLLVGCGSNTTSTKVDTPPTATSVEVSTTEPSTVPKNMERPSPKALEELSTPAPITVVSSERGTVLPSTSASPKTVTTQPSNRPLKYTHKVVNNQGIEVQGEVDEYIIKIYSDTEVEANPKHIHKGVVVKLNGEKSRVIPIEISYLDKNIMIGVYDKKGKRVTASETIKVTDVPVVVVELHI